MQFILIFFWGGGWCLEYHSHCQWGKHYSGAKLSVPEGIPGIKLYFSRSGRGYLHGKSFLTILVYIMYSSIFLHYSKKRYFEINLIKINWQFTLSLNSSASLFSAFRKYFSESTLDNAAMKRSFLGTCMKIM